MGAGPILPGGLNGIGANGPQLSQDIKGLDPKTMTPAQIQAANRNIARSQEYANNETIAAHTGYYADGRMRQPDFESVAGEDGLMQDQYRLANHVQNIDPNMEAADKFRQEAMRDGLSKSTQLMIDGVGQREAADIDQGRRMAANQAAGAFGNLALSGGASSGSRERLAGQGMRQALMARSQARRGASKDILGLKAQDEQNRLQGLQSMQTMDFQKANFDADNANRNMQAQQFDIGNSLNEVNAERAWDSQRFEESNKAWAAGKQADAQRKSSSCFAGDTPIKMADGSIKAISEVEVGDELQVGGKVTTTTKHLVQDFTDMYNFNGVIVSGCHAVIEGDQWLRVRDTAGAVEITDKPEIIYNLANETHLLLINDSIFSDFEETEDATVSDEESIQIMNKRLRGLLDEYAS